MLLSGSIILLAGGTAVSQTGQDKTDTRLPLTNKSVGGSISGRVVLASGASSNLHLRITLSTIEAPVMTIYTDNTGEFIFNDLHAGTYYVAVSVEGGRYEPLNEKVWVNAGQPLSLTLHLKERGGVESKASAASPGRVVTATENEKDVPGPARREFDTAHKLAKRGDLEGAIDHLKAALVIFPDYVVAKNDLGVQYLRLKRFDEASEQFSAILAKNPAYFDARLNLGIVFVEQKRFNEAIKELTDAVSLDSSNPAAHLFLGIAALDMDDLPVAEKELVKALVLGGEQYSVAHYYFAHVYLKTGRRPEAAREFKLYLDSEPTGEMAAQARDLFKQLSEAK